MGDTFKYIAPVFSWIMDAMAPEAPTTTGQESEQGVKTNFRSTDAYIPIVYGKRKVGGNDVFITTTGSSNEFLWIVQSLAEGECDGIYQEEGVDQIFLDGELYNIYGGYVNYYFSAGTSGQSVESNLNSEYPSWTDPLRNTSYIVFKLEWDENRESGQYNFQGIPERLLILKGKKVVDFRTPTPTAGWSDNPVLCLYDFMTNTRYGMGLDEDKFDVTSWTNAANYCDLKDFKLNMVINGDKKSGDTIKEILSHFRGSLVWFDGKFYCKYADLNYESIVYHITDSDILVDDDGTAQISMSQPGRFSKPKMMEVEFYDSEKEYTQDIISIGEDDDKPEKLTLKGCTDRTMASNLGVYALERARLDRTISGSFRDHLVILDPHDLVYVTSDAMTIADQIMRVIETSVSPEGVVTLTLQFESFELYDDDYDVDVTTVYQSTLPDPSDEPPSVSNVQVEELLRFHRGRTYTDLSISFDTPDYAWFDHVEVYTSTTTDTLSAYKHQYDVTTDFKIENIEEGSEIYIVLRTVNIWGGKQTFDNGYKINKIILGKTAAPQSITALAAIGHEGGVNLIADPVDDPDIEGYEFRIGDNWSSAVFLAFNRKPVFSMSSVRPATHTFWCNTLGTNGVYGDNPRSASITVTIPRGFTYDDNLNVSDYSDGTFYNTEQIIYSGDTYLRCTHSMGLSGSWVDVEDATNFSPLDDYYCFLYFAALLGEGSIVVIGAGTEWQSKFVGTPGVSGTTWFEGGATTQTWAEIFELTAAPRVSITLKQSQISGDEFTNPSVEVKHFEIFSTILSQHSGTWYSTVRIVIEDPSEEVYAYVPEFQTLIYR